MTNTVTTSVTAVPSFATSLDRLAAILEPLVAAYRRFEAMSASAADRGEDLDPEDDNDLPAWVHEMKENELTLGVIITEFCVSNQPVHEEFCAWAKTALGLEEEDLWGFDAAYEFAIGRAADERQRSNAPLN